MMGVGWGGCFRLGRGNGRGDRVSGCRRDIFRAGSQHRQAQKECRKQAQAYFLYHFDSSFEYSKGTVTYMIRQKNRFVKAD